MKFGRKGDKWLMLEFMRLGYDMDSLGRLNCVRIYMQVVFFLDVLGASGRDLDPRYLTRRRVEQRWSKYTFGLKRPPYCDFVLWNNALQNVVPSGGLLDALGPLEETSPKI